MVNVGLGPEGRNFGLEAVGLENPANSAELSTLFPQPAAQWLHQSGDVVGPRIRREVNLELVLAYA